MAPEAGSPSIDPDSFSFVHDLLENDSYRLCIEILARGPREMTAEDYARREALLGNITMTEGYLLLAEGVNKLVKLGILAEAAVNSVEAEESLAKMSPTEEDSQLHRERAEALRQRHQALLRFAERLKGSGEASAGEA